MREHPCLMSKDGRCLGISRRQLSASIAEADVRTTVLETSLLAEDSVLSLGVRGESPLVGHDDVLATRKFVLASAKSLDDMLQVGLLGANGKDDLTDVHASNETDRLTEGLTHTSLETICACATQHLVDAENVERVKTNAKMERILSCDLGHVLVDDNTSGLKCLRRELLILA